MVGFDEIIQSVEKLAVTPALSMNPPIILKKAVEATDCHR
jgi:hypothetical protein